MVQQPLSHGRKYYSKAVSWDTSAPSCSTEQQAQWDFPGSP